MSTTQVLKFDNVEVEVLDVSSIVREEEFLHKDLAGLGVQSSALLAGGIEVLNQIPHQHPAGGYVGGMLVCPTSRAREKTFRPRPRYRERSGSEDSPAREGGQDS